MARCQRRYHDWRPWRSRPRVPGSTQAADRRGIALHLGDLHHVNQRFREHRRALGSERPRWRQRSRPPTPAGTPPPPGGRDRRNRPAGPKVVVRITEPIPGLGPVGVCLGGRLPPVEHCTGAVGSRGPAQQIPGAYDRPSRGVPVRPEPVDWRARRPRPRRRPPRSTCAAVRARPGRTSNQAASPRETGGRHPPMRPLRR